ncbi:hypothetical protein PBI_CANTARE_2 [Brevibacterium phage Cantare]|uniref:Uncharacterized protein n=1 Tax=Brevibacterium phage Cantare TaxID=2338395 RepID=A0A3G3LZF9_9CAUD|nr:hypothetical protein PQD70_gp002 [Brevibacterium phage Cantare]AYQ99223.1 hypothetical protein PBI_CANTARE_2 [Brevibacterium phage Cantare]
MAQMKTKAFGITESKRPKGKKTFAPVKRVWDDINQSATDVPYVRLPISASITDDEELLSDAFHRAVTKWRKQTGLEHPGKVYIDCEPTGNTSVDEDGITCIEVRTFVVVETAPEISAR